MSTITASITTTITPLTSPMNHADIIVVPEDQIQFEAEWEAFNAQLATTTVGQINDIADEIDVVTGQINVVAGEVATNAGIATTKAAEASTSADNASASEIAAAASAASAAAIAGAFVGTSTTSITIGTGNQTFTTQTSEQYTAGTWVSAVSAANATNWMIGQVVSYSGSTLVVNVTNTNGSGTYADWNLSLTGTPGATGPAGPTFNGGTITTELLATAGITVGGDIAFTQIDKGTVSSGTVTFTQSDGNVQRLQVGGALTIATTGWHTSGTYSDLVLQLVNAGSATVTLPTINWIKPDGTTTTTVSEYLTAIARPTLQTSGVDFMYLFTVDGGTTVYGKLI